LRIETYFEADAAHIQGIESWETNHSTYRQSGTFTTYSKFSADLGPVLSEGSGDFRSMFRCKACGEYVQTMIHQQEMLHYPAVSLTKNKDIMEEVLSGINRPTRTARIVLSGIMWVSLLLSLLYVYFPQAYVSEFVGSNLTTEPFFLLIAAVGLAVFLLIWDRGWRLSRFQIRAIRRGKKDLLIDRPYASRLNLPVPRWAEVIKVVREVYIHEPGHSFLFVNPTDFGDHVEWSLVVQPFHAYEDSVVLVGKSRCKEWHMGRVNSVLSGD
jgi:hypothetical protein